MLCRKCGKEINDNVQCSYCGCENDYARENTPEHLLYIEALFDKIQVSNAEQNVNTAVKPDAAAAKATAAGNTAAKNMDSKTVSVKDAAADQVYSSNFGLEPNKGVIDDNLDEEEEMIRKKYGILINIFTAVACICCLCVGFIVGSIVERGQMDKEVQARDTQMAQAESETAGETKAKPEFNTTAGAEAADTEKSDTEAAETAIVSPFRIETDATGATYLFVDLPVGSGSYWYDFSEIFDVLNPENMISLASYGQQSLMTTDGSEIKVYTLRLPFDKVEVWSRDAMGVNGQNSENSQTADPVVNDSTAAESGNTQSSNLNETDIPEVNVPVVPSNKHD